MGFWGFGAGTVRTKSEVQQIRDVGGTLVVSPHTDVDLIEYTRELSLVSIPGFYTATEAMNALSAGASYLKFFPADLTIYRSLKAILPQNAKVIAVGGIQPESIPSWSGVSGFGIGSALFRPTDTLKDIYTKANRLTQLVRGE